MKNKETSLLVFLFLAGLAFRVLCFLQNANSPLSAQLFLDESYYVNFGRAVASGYLLGEPGAFYMDPLYGYFLGLAFWIFGEDLALLKFLQLVIDAGNVLLIYLLGKKIAGQRAGLISGLLYAVYPVAAFYALLLLKTTLTVTALLLFTLFLIKVAEGKKSSQWFLLGCFIGLMVSLRANLLLAAPLGLIAYLIVEKPELRSFMKNGILLAAGLMLLLLPGALRNLAVTGEMMWLNSQSGRLLYLCNNPENLSGLYNVPSFTRADPIGMEEDFQREAEQRMGRRMSSKEVSVYWRNETLSFLLNNPQDAVLLMANKLRHIVGNGEIPVNHSYALAARFSPIFHFHFPNFALALSLGLVGLILLLRENRKLTWLLPAILTMFVTMLIFYASSRFRFPMVPFLLVGGGAFLVALLEFSPVKKKLLTAGVISAALLFGISAKVPSPSYVDNDAYFLAKAYLQQNQPKLARKIAGEAMAEFPAQERFLVQSGNISLYEGKFDEALSFFEKAGTMNPELPEAWNNIGLIYLKTGKPKEAISSLEQALKLSPRSETLLLHGQALQAIGNQERAKDSFHAVIKREKPNSLLALQARQALAVLESRH